MGTEYARNRYQWSRAAPKLTKPKPNVIIRLCSIECNFAQPLSHPSNSKFQADISNWGAISERLYVWNCEYRSLLFFSSVPIPATFESYASEPSLTFALDLPQT